MKNPISSQPGGVNRRGISGFTLIELMVSIVIGMILIVFISSMYLNSKSSFRLNDDNARLQEDGNYALSMIGRSLMQAGYGVMRTVTTTNFKGNGFTACDNGFANPLASTPDFSCAGTAAEPGFTVSYSVDAYDSVNSPVSGIGTDCNGNNANGTAVNNFFIATKSGETSSSLFCAGVAGTVAQPILNNVDHMVLTYGVDTAGTYAASRFPLSASTVAALPSNPVNKTGWDQLVSVTVCLEVHSTNTVTNGAQTYVNCAGTSKTASDNKLHAALTRTFTLRNRAAPSLT